MSIVIVDDSITNLIVLKHLAKTHGERPILTFSNPEGARDYLSCNSADLVIVDCEMPGLDGISFISQMRAFRHHGKTPVLMVTNHREGEVRHAALAAGATEFLSKPVNAAEFKLRLRNLLQLTVHGDMA
jgi:DNA-binding response OmpR family regulator